MALSKAIVLYILTGSIGTYIAFVILGSITNEYVRLETSRITVSDSISLGKHEISGYVTLPSRCHRLISRIVKLDDTNFLFDFRTWEDPNRRCSDEPTAERFELTLFAPTGIAYQALMDDEPIALSVVQHIAKK